MAPLQTALSTSTALLPSTAPSTPNALPIWGAPTPRPLGKSRDLTLLLDAGNDVDVLLRPLILPEPTPLRNVVSTVLLLDVVLRVLPTLPRRPTALLHRASTGDSNNTLGKGRTHHLSAETPGTSDRALNPTLTAKITNAHSTNLNPPGPMAGSLSRTFDSIPPLLLHASDIRLHPFLPRLSKITSDLWVLKIISHGYALEFSSLPPLGQIVRTPTSQVLQEEVQSLLAKHAIQPVAPEDTRGFYSWYFTVQKRDGGLRPILDLRELNSFIEHTKFQMTTLEAILPLLYAADWFSVVDLQGAYFHISIRPCHRKYLRFQIANSTYQFKALPFGLSMAPRSSKYKRYTDYRKYLYVDMRS
ncbi:hypothetical protein JRQ81_000197 [Phrynocephalus forsythii]|uniref:Reverse transcriptase domain-containing protein n=1 Tax=Phrynocephalus forsythii TaxID=171643 RepID=A0A9Q0Y606_9SAUR|nr:hypothetical protein JRQ81_000197 [Phrynocephalus forsythii]